MYELETHHKYIKPNGIRAARALPEYVAVLVASDIQFDEHDSRMTFWKLTGWAARDALI